MGAIEAPTSRLNELVEKFNSSQHKVTNLELCVQKLEKKIDDLENRSRRNNLIVYGIREMDNETEDNLMNSVVNEVLSDRLAVNVKSIERIHRLGKWSSNRIRPVILKFGDFMEKKEVLRNARKLKGTAIFINEDFSLLVRNVRKKLWDSAKDNRDKGERATLLYDKLKIGDVMYAWDEEKDERVQLPPRAANEQHNYARK